MYFSVATAKQVPLTLSNLLSLDWEEHGVEKHFSLRSRVSAKWRDLGMRLDITFNDLQGFSYKYQMDFNECWMQVMQRWLDGCSWSYHPTWDGLYKLLEDIRKPAIARELKDAVQACSKSSS